ncbi:phosphoribosylanthranilate isomerase, partial [Campylobacter coli]
ALSLKPKIIDLNSKIEKENHLKDVEKIKYILKEMRK